MSVPATCRLISRKIWGERMAADRDTKSLIKLKDIPCKNKNICLWWHILHFLFAKALDCLLHLSVSSHLIAIHIAQNTLFSLAVTGVPKANWCLFEKIDIYFPYPFGNTNTSYWIFISRGLVARVPRSIHDVCRRRRNVARSSSTGCGTATRRWWQRCYHRKGVFMCSAIWVKLVLHGQLSFPVRPHSLSLSLQRIQRICLSISPYP